ncbi:N,N'-diacetylchitobiose transport system substrate-binding protein [Mumia flava]|uniref:N,N'-diacetylchitobiose transport system substrate-binding protein n=1 Tax=Mumia flava TaxID=1348852 RepID=A0A0B2BKQ4_9ACTN|nr:extracellular solute-binding protein [Mumia flava]PJJ54042.1 N,N'-diacetylchitobiose transport system substrate-binding protein [Mumia flava]
MKLTRLAALGVASALALTACGGSDSDDTASDTPPETMKLWLAGETDTPEELVNWLESTYEADHEGTDLEIQQIDWGELIPRLQTALSSEDQTPDVFEVGNTQSPTFTAAGAFTDLSDKMDELGDNIGPEGFLEAGAYEGAQYAVPYYWGSRYVFFSKKAFTDAGIEVPTTLEEFSTAAAALKKQGNKDYSGFWRPGQDWRNGISWMFANGGDIATLDGDTWTGQLSSEGSVAGLEQWQALGDTTTAPVDGLDSEAWVPFNNGEAAMFMAPSWARWSVEEKLADDLGALALPGVDGDAAPVFAGGSNIGISAKSPNQDEAFELLQLIYSDEYQQMLAENGLGPANSDFTSAMGDDEFAQAAIAAASNAKLTPASPAWTDIETSGLMEEFFGKIAAGGDVAALAAEYDEKLEAALNG